MTISTLNLFYIILIMLLLIELMPSRPFNDEKLGAEQIAILYEKYGLDQPLMVPSA